MENKEMQKLSISELDIEGLKKYYKFDQIYNVWKVDNLYIIDVFYREIKKRLNIAIWKDVMKNFVK